MSGKNVNESLNIKNQGADPAPAVAESFENLDKAEGWTFAAIENMKIQTAQEVSNILQNYEKNHTGITEGLGTALGAGTGAVGSLTALSSMGTVSGLSGAGVATGLAAAGGLLGGGMFLGIGVLAAPVAALGMFGYNLAKKRKKINEAAAFGQTAKKICDIQSRLMQHEEHFQEDIAKINATLERLTRVKNVNS